MIVAWDEYLDKSRRRLWCKKCRDLGRPWILGSNCEHVTTAQATRQMSREEAESTLNRYMQKPRN